jgi:hypothetical protein
VTNPHTPEDGALIWDDRSGPGRSRARPQRASGPAAGPADAAPAVPEPPAEAAAAAEPESGRITLRDAADRYGVSTSTLRKWARMGEIDGLLVESPRGRRWMVSPETVAERVASGRGRAAGPAVTPRPAPEAGAMLVPRAAWDKLMDQLGNLHESGQQLAEARERAARYETEVRFLRERLSEMREERDGLRAGVDPGSSSPGPPPGGAGRRSDWRGALRRWMRRFPSGGSLG